VRRLAERGDDVLSLKLADVGLVRYPSNEALDPGSNPYCSLRTRRKLPTTDAPSYDRSSDFTLTSTD